MVANTGESLYNISIAKVCGNLSSRIQMHADAKDGEEETERKSKLPESLSEL